MHVEPKLVSFLGRGGELHLAVWCSDQNAVASKPWRQSVRILDLSDTFNIDWASVALSNHSEGAVLGEDALTALGARLVRPRCAGIHRAPVQSLSVRMDPEEPAVPLL